MCLITVFNVRHYRTTKSRSIISRVINLNSDFSLEGYGARAAASHGCTRAQASPPPWIILIVYDEKSLPEDVLSDYIQSGPIISSSIDG